MTNKEKLEQAKKEMEANPKSFFGSPLPFARLLIIIADELIQLRESR